jgi:hypothetical protein
MTRHSRLVEFGVLCEKCGKRTAKSIAWLTVHNNIPCSDCGNVIDLTAGDNAVAIQKLAQQCSELDAIAAKRS